MELNILCTSALTPDGGLINGVGSLSIGFDHCLMNSGNWKNFIDTPSSKCKNFIDIARSHPNDSVLENKIWWSLKVSHPQPHRIIERDPHSMTPFLLLINSPPPLWENNKFTLQPHQIMMDPFIQRPTLQGKETKF